MMSAQIVPIVEAEAQVSIAVSALPAVIASDADQIAAIDALNILAATRKALDGARDSLVRPLNAKVKAINGAYKPLLDRLEKAETQCKQSIGAWRESERQRIAAEQERIRRENDERERAAREAEQRERERVAIETLRAAEAAGMSAQDSITIAALEAADVKLPEPVREVAPVAPLSTVSGSLGMAQASMVWRMDVIDALAFMRWAAQTRELAAAYLTINEAEVKRQYMPKGDATAPEIPGLRFQRVEQIGSRRF